MMKPIAVNMVEKSRALGLAFPGSGLTRPHAFDLRTQFSTYSSCVSLLQEENERNRPKGMRSG